MSALEAIWLGIVQGLTEFLPVSSSGHLVIFQELFGGRLQSGLVFEVALHVATLLSVPLGLLLGDRPKLGRHFLVKGHFI